MRDEQFGAGPRLYVSRGRVVVENGVLHAERGSGKFIARGTPDPVNSRETAAAN